jgi:glycosyltransferase involved in cell wall biosynthesis
MKVSILLITYNHEKYIRKAIEGIQIQRECPEFEIIVADDGSSDKTICIAKELLNTFSNVKIFSNEINLGITKNYQKSFSLCKGEYIFVLEGDDYWIDPLKIKKQAEFLDQNPFCVLCGHSYLLQREDLSVFTPPVSNIHYHLFDCKDLILDSSIVNNFSTCCYRRSVLEKISPETYNVVSYDWMINMSVAQFGLIGRINEPMSVYRVSSSGAWSKMTEKEQLEGIVNIIPEYDRIMDYKYHDYFEIRKQKVKEQLQITYPGKSASSVIDYIPPFIIALGKLIVPPAFFKFMRNKFSK